MKKIFLFIAVAISFHAFAQKTFVHCGKLIDAVSNNILAEKTIIVEGNKMIDIKDGYVTPGMNDVAIDLKNKTGMPGLMDIAFGTSNQKKCRRRFVHERAAGHCF